MTKIRLAKYYILPLLILIFPLKQTNAQEFSYPRNWLVKSTTKTQLASYLSTIDKWRQAKKKSIIQKINNLPDSTKNKIIDRAEEKLSFRWPTLPATVFLQFTKTGNRSNYEDIYFKRRNVLSTLVIAELLEQKGRFIPQIVNGIWAICEETTWALPAHMYLQRNDPGKNVIIGPGDGATPLPNPGENVVGLFVGETAALISWTYFLLQNELDSVTTVIPERMRYELERRVIHPYLKRDDFWWMGFSGHSVDNNWNPWVNGNVLVTALLTETDTSELVNTVYKTMRSVDYFINQYPVAGGCSEGPSYWNVAAGSLIKYLQLLKDATNGKIDIASHPLIEKMGGYIYKMHIGGNYFVNYADAHPRITPNITAVFEFGKVCNDNKLKRFAAYFANRNGSATREFNRLDNNLQVFIGYLQIYNEIKHVKPVSPLPKLSWFPGLQVLTTRTQKGSLKGLFLSAKGGTNGESHNHNDVGNFIIYVKAKPAIIDIGVGTYTRQTFSKNRYKIFTFQSAWHNLPTINGVMQHAGGRFQAKNVQYSHHGKIVHLSMDIAGAYPKKAAVKYWIRSLAFNGSKVILKEKYKLSAYKKPFTLSLITPLAVQVKGNNMILKDRKQNRILNINFDPKQFNVKVQTKALKDPKLQSTWGDKLNRILLTDKIHKLNGEYELIFTNSD